MTAMRDTLQGRKPVKASPSVTAKGNRNVNLGPILVVDDDRDAADTTSALLEAMGLAVITVYSARDGLDRLDERADVCLVVSDIRMPGVDGFDFIRVVKHRFPSLPALLTTGLPITEEDVIPRGASILQKPYASDELREAIAAQLQTPLDPRPAPR
jgi:CheY-like chemotaxis protein